MFYDFRDNSMIDSKLTGYGACVMSLSYASLEVERKFISETTSY